MLSITLAGTADGWSLVRKRADIVGNTYGAFTSAVVLFSGPYKYFFTYRSGAGQEMESWTDSTALPRSVMLHMVDRRKPLASLTIEIPVLASMSAACLANSALPGCPALPAPESADLAKQFGFGPGTQ